MTDRVKRLRDISTTVTPSISMERAKYFTEAYKKWEGSVSTPEMRALALLHFMKHRSLYIERGELIVGEKGDKPQAAPTFPELCCHTVEDLKIMNDREIIFFKNTEEQRKWHAEEIIPYWENRSIRHRILSAMSDEWRDAYAAGIFTEFMEQRGPGHTVCSDKIYNKGFSDYKRDIAEAISKLDYQNDPEAYRRREELSAMSIACDAIITLGRRYAELALSLAETETDEEWKADLLKIAENCSVVPEFAPRTFHQALQMYWFVHLCVTSELNPWDAYSPGRLDQHVYPFYKADVQNGTLTSEQALELLECLWVKFNNQPAPPKVGVTLKESGTYTDFANINTGGITPDGEDGVNPVSYLILDCMDEMKLLQPSSNVQISRKTPNKFLMRACEIASKGWGQPAFYNTEAIVQELLAAGKSLADARRGGTSGCVETGAFGNEAYILTGYFNIPKILELTLYNGYDHYTGKTIGLRLGEPEDFDSYEKLYSAFCRQMEHFINIKINGSAIIERIYADYMPVPFLSIITNDCIATGRDYNAGGARYNTSYIQGVGIGTITDSLSSIKRHVYENGDFTLRELTRAMEANFEGEQYGDMYHKIRTETPFYGNDDDYADDIMQSVFDFYQRTITGRPNVRGGQYRVNMLPTTCHVYFGEVMQASPNGRLAAKPVSEGISPDKGADTHGPTAVIRSCAKMDHLRTGGTLLNQKFTPAVLAGDAGKKNLAALIRTYFSMDGHHIQFNVIDKQTLLDAQAHPEEYRDLIVRVAGYSDHFRNLSRALQDEIIERTEQSF